MKRLVTSGVLAVFALGLLGGAAVAQDNHPHDSAMPSHDDHGHPDGQGGPGGGHSSHRGWHDQSDWHRGGHVAYDDWHNAPPVDYHAHHLRRPPHGYEWRQSNGNYVLAAVATGAIMSIIANGH